MYFQNIDVFPKYKHISKIQMHFQNINAFPKYKCTSGIDIHISTQASKDPGGGFLLGPALDSKANLDLLV